ncbi:MAG: 5-methyltetrahydropteroyltriglutamate--homocysteine S-methyltransferase [Proteobacteria bacterium]|nr:5-methyltetrahydropteroyltriglutamate--homocysteine S-methyltransferase [Pseudomonadota bacterium]
MITALNLGVPRVGAQRELKKTVEAYWQGKLGQKELLQAGAALRRRHWQMQKDAGIHAVPCNDFSFYDQVLDMAALLGCVPKRHRAVGAPGSLEVYFSMARGSKDAPAMEMTKWFDTNYHYLVPEFEEGQEFKLSGSKVFDEFQESRKAGFNTFPVLIGPVTFALLGKAKVSGWSLKDTVARLVPVYEQILQKLAELGADWIQIDEPCLVTDLSEEARAAYKTAYEKLGKVSAKLNPFIATYFGALGDNLDLAFSLPVAALHVDLVRAPQQLEACIAAAAKTGKKLGLGLVDGRNIWRNDLSVSLAVVEKAAAKLGAENVAVGPSCSLLHTPMDLDLETELDAELKGWMAFAKQKLAEIALLAKGGTQGRNAIAAELKASDAAQVSRKASKRIHDPAVKQRSVAVTDKMLNRHSGFAQRAQLQRGAFKLPAYPTTSIGSFPQTPEIREARAQHKKGALNDAGYEAAMKKEIASVVRYQEEIGMDVLVHGEAERNDMVEYFGEQLKGYAFSKNGWVQSYGSRCVKPPLLFGDVSRPKPMTVPWTQYAQSITPKIMKGMLTGPVTMLQWSFVRDDQPRSETCKQLALAIRDEVADLEKAGIRIIQIDEPAIREGLPLRKAEWKAYLKWAVDAFRLTACTVEDKTQIHTHMCYSEFNDIIEAVGAMDADVISIETSRSQMELLDAFVNYKYPNEIGPGVYDIHSPRVPSVEEMTVLLEKARAVLKPEQIWVNPDCGLKTRGWPEVKAALQNMVQAARLMREREKRAAA